MRHRHPGPPVTYRTRKGQIRQRKRPIHPITMKRKREGMRSIRHFSFSDRERHLDNIKRLQQEINELKEEFDDRQRGIQDLQKSAIRFDRDRFKDFTGEERKNLSIGEINEIFESEPNPFEIDAKELISEEKDFQRQLENKINAIEEEKEFLDE